MKRVFRVGSIALLALVSAGAFRPSHQLLLSRRQDAAGRPRRSSAFADRGSRQLSLLSQLHLVDPSLVDSCSSALVSLTSAGNISPEPIHTAFSVATFLPQPFWLLMILLPKAKITKQIMGGLEIPLLLSLIHLFIVAASIATQGSGVTAPLSEFNDVFDPFGNPQQAFSHMVSSYPNFVAEEWSHVLTWDLMVGWWLWRDGLRRNIFTSHSVLLCNLIGPPGLLLHWLTCRVWYKVPIYEEREEFGDE